MKRTKIRLKPSKLNKHLVLERIGNYRNTRFSIIFIDFGHRCAYIKPNKDLLIWLLYTLRRNCSKKYFEILDRYGYNLVPLVHGGMGFICFNENRDRGFTDGLVIGWDYGHCNDARDIDQAIKYFGDQPGYYSLFKLFNGVAFRINTQDDVLRDLKKTIDSIYDTDKKYTELKKELQRMIFKPFKKKRKYKNK